MVYIISHIASTSTTGGKKYDYFKICCNSVIFQWKFSVETDIQEKLEVSSYVAVYKVFTIVFINATTFSMFI